MVEAHPEIVELDTAGTVIHVNQAVEVITGLTRDDLLGRSASSLFPGIALTTETVGHIAEDDVPPEARERLLTAFRDWRAS